MERIIIWLERVGLGGRGRGRGGETISVSYSFCKREHHDHFSLCTQGFAAFIKLREAGTKEMLLLDRLLRWHGCWCVDEN